MYAPTVICETLEPRLCLASGDVDLSFGDTGRVLLRARTGEQIRIITGVAQDDGKVLLAGLLSTPRRPAGDFLVIRLTARGRLDGGFGDRGRVVTHFGPGRSSISDIALQADGGILAAGFAARRDNPQGTVGAVARYLPNGALDTSFGNKGKRIVNLVEDTFLTEITAAPGNKIVAGGGTIDFDDDDPNNAAPDEFYTLVRFNADGSRDDSFGTDGTVLEPIRSGTYILDLLVQPDGKVVIGSSIGPSADENFLLIRFDNSGAIDPSFGVQGEAITSLAGQQVISDLAILGNGDLLAAGSPRSTGNAVLARYGPNGSPKRSFGNDGVVITNFPTRGTAFLSMTVQRRRITLANAASCSRPTCAARVTRFTTAGEVDTEFGDGGRMSIASTLTGQHTFGEVLIQAPRGKVLLVGNDSDLEQSVIRRLL